MKVVYRILFAALLFAMPALAPAQSAPAELRLEVITASSTVVTIAARMIIVPTIMNVEAVSVAVQYDPSQLNINANTTVSNRYFQSSGWENASVVPWSSDVVIYGEYHPTFGSNPVLRNAPPTLCHFNFYPKSTAPGIAAFTVYANNPTGALTYYFEGGFSQQQNFFPVTNLPAVSYPVELTSFTAVQQGEAIVLQWITANETNNYGFYVERRAGEGSAGEHAWESLDFVNGAGDTRLETQYLFIDRTVPRDGQWQYRLKQQDYDGTVTYTRVINVDYRQTPHVFALQQNFPNPVSGVNGGATVINYDVAERSNVRLTVRNMLGQLVETLVDDARDAGRYSATWRPSWLPTGTYIATLATEIPGSGRSEMRHIRMHVVR
jgi:hypothetical protein